MSLTLDVRFWRPSFAKPDVGDVTSEAAVIWIIALFLFF
jgi:hypothetical protein